MKSNFLFLFLTFSTCVFSQDFAPVGSIWYYNQSTINPEYITYKTFEATMDTTINGQKCRKITESIENNPQNIQFMFSRNDSVFFLADNDFHLLYDFSADKGDTIILDYFKTSDGKSLEMVIDSISTIEINGVTKKLQYITCGDGLSIEFPGPIIEDIGSAYYMFPIYDDTYSGTLRCYQNNDLGLFKNPFYNGGWSKECDYISTKTQVANDCQYYIITPNPVTDVFTVSDLRYKSNYIISDLNGKIMQRGVIDTNQEINIKDFKSSIYILEIQLESEKTNRILIKK